MTTRLTQAQVDAELAGLPAWNESGGAIQRTFTFAGFVEAMRFVNLLAAHAERVQHHPDMLVRYNKVTVSVSTHDAGGITAKDFALAHRADEMAR